MNRNLVTAIFQLLDQFRKSFRDPTKNKESRFDVAPVKKFY